MVRVVKSGLDMFPRMGFIVLIVLARRLLQRVGCRSLFIVVQLMAIGHILQVIELGSVHRGFSIIQAVARFVLQETPLICGISIALASKPILHMRIVVGVWETGNEMFSSAQPQKKHTE